MGKAKRWLKGLFSGRGGDKKSKWVFAKSSNMARKELGFGGGGNAFFGGEGGLREEEDNRRAIAMAAATAAVAEAAVAAAQAAADQVVRLASSSRVSSQVSVRGTRMPEVLAAVRIQSAFRGCLARRALKALKGLVKLQALVRGRMVRKEAAETLRRMHALVKAQERARAYRGGGGVLLQDAASDSTSNYSNLIYVYDNNTPESKLKWPKHWTEEEEEEASNDETNAKVLEIDTGKPRITHDVHHHHHLRYQQQYSLSSDQNYPNSRSSYVTVAQGSSVTSPSSVSTRQKNRLTSRPASALGRGGKRSLFNESTTYPSDPNYMTNTESSRAKSRSQSAPRQRSPGFEKSSTQHCIKRAPSSFSKLASAKAYTGSGRLDRMGIPINTC